MAFYSSVKATDGNQSVTINWSDWLDGGSIDSSVWTVKNGSVVGTPLITDPRTQAIVTGGTNGAFVKAFNKITSGQRTHTRSVLIPIEAA